MNFSMILCVTTDWLTMTTSGVSILTPIVLFIWFCYSQKQMLSKNYFDEISGIYAGFIDTPIHKPTQGGKVYSGIIMNIRQVISKGYFRGDFDFGATESKVINNAGCLFPLHDGVFSFFGKLNHKIYCNKKRHPYKHAKNRKYYGVIYVVSRLDIDDEKYKFEDFIHAEYSIIHYRERQSLQFVLIKNYKPGLPMLPDKFTLDKSIGYTFEPLEGLKRIVFRNTRVDK